jgi:hypothetical protein
MTTQNTQSTQNTAELFETIMRNVWGTTEGFDYNAWQGANVTAKTLGAKLAETTEADAHGESTRRWHFIDGSYATIGSKDGNEIGCVILDFGH